MKYNTKEKNHSDWLNKCPQYNTDICSNFHGTVFDDFIRNYITDRCNIMCSINAHDKLQPTQIDDSSRIGGRKIPKNETTAALEVLGATLNFIGCWLKQFHNNY